MGGIILFIIIGLGTAKVILTSNDNNANPAILKADHQTNIITEENINRGKNLYNSCNGVGYS